MAIPLAIPSMANRGDHRAVPLLPVLPAAMHLPVLPGSHGFLLPGPIISPRPITCKAPRPPPPLLLQRPTKCTGPSPLCMTCSLPCLTSLPSSTPVF
ncbi:S2-RNase [Pyrus ussuriensis x Pyrus communis]|uniref:S2-RNase n=1 Tax=Pyrus ussuriensis x Pyrus communis TaxID=2448454 RepID=A0A5N5FQV8_9ROSA|nr:S2-RNase [Pyrus ussuriensis x Pyrus communis]KAB2605287.1 S2-RNase [Pyrus ussuriensis x Pyrus communis]KAB2605627.1 S2-RNase [Pyrus ussuriensis x Pyrus communis]KAB2611345.1 S2-RNase [Pyrus ussuriensis x Pyrus communis]KAB2616382.1 S2-RNase [Pyrus ussuriensis x Pyrus communis]